MYLLDTNHCSGLLEGHPSISKKLLSLDNTLVATCVIVQGELVYMAEKSDRRDLNITHLEELFQDINIYPIDSETARIYGYLKAAIVDYFGPKERAKRRKITIEKLGFTENDLWIAAIARRNNLIIVSADQDFERLKEIVEINLENWYSLSAS